MYLWYLELNIIWKWYYISIHHISNIVPQIFSSKCKHHSIKCVINMRVWGNGEEGLREWGDRWELNWMELKTENKTPSLISHKRYEWTLHQPTWKGIQLHRNWFTSRESEHSPCNGQAKALKNAKDQLKNYKRLFSFLKTSFY